MNRILVSAGALLLAAALAEDDQVVLEPPAGGREDGVALDILLLKVPEAKVGKNRVHLDVRVSAAGEVPPEIRRHQVDAEVARLESFGGTHLHTEEDEHDYFAVMADPEGNEFCIN